MSGTNDVSSSPAVAPYVRHEQFKTTLAAAAAAPGWAPTHEIKLFLRSPGTQIDLLNDWIATVHRRGLCSWCAAPLEWENPSARRETCSGKHRQAKHRVTKGRQTWRRANGVYNLIDKLSEIDYSEPERQARHERYMAMLDGTYRAPPRLGHAAPKFKPRDNPSSSMVFRDVGSMAFHDRLSLKADNARDAKADAIADQWLKEHE